MATLPPDPYAPDPVRNPDGTPATNDQPAALPGPDNEEPDDTANEPTKTQA